MIRLIIQIVQISIVVAVTAVMGYLTWSGWSASNDSLTVGHYKGDCGPVPCTAVVERMIPFWGQKITLQSSVNADCKINVTAYPSGTVAQPDGKDPLVVLSGTLKAFGDRVSPRATTDPSSDAWQAVTLDKLSDGTFRPHTNYQICTDLFGRPITAPEDQPNVKPEDRPKPPRFVDPADGVEKDVTFIYTFERPL